MKHKVKHVHFVGIGGAGMSGIAEVLITMGYKVSGSDLQASETTRRLEELGGQIFIGHQEAKKISARQTNFVRNRNNTLSVTKGTLPAAPDDLVVEGSPVVGGDARIREFDHVALAIDQPIALQAVGQAPDNLAGIPLLPPAVRRVRGVPAGPRPAPPVAGAGGAKPSRVPGVD